MISVVQNHSTDYVGRHVKYQNNLFLFFNDRLELKQELPRYNYLFTYIICMLAYAYHGIHLVNVVKLSVYLTICIYWFPATQMHCMFISLCYRLN